MYLEKSMRHKELDININWISFLNPVKRLNLFEVRWLGNQHFD